MRYTDEEKAAWKERMRGLVQKVAALSDEERKTLAARMPITTCEGHTLSFFNQCFLSFQANGTPLTVIGGFQQWKKVGRSIKRGEHAVGCIYVPLFPAKGDREIEGEPDPVRFRLVPVFEVSQTEEGR